MNDIFEAFEKLNELLECLIEEYKQDKNPETLRLIKDCFGLCFRLGRIANGFGKEKD